VRVASCPGGRAVDCRAEPISAVEVAAAVRGEPAPIELSCARPGPLHERVGILERGRSYPLRTAIALAARSRGWSTSVDEDLAAVRERLASLDPPAVSTATARRRLAETEDGAALEDRVTALRGQLVAARDRGEEPEALAEARERAVAELTERQTERVAAEQRLERARAAARSARDRREQRLRLEDRERNLLSRARDELVAAAEPHVRRALDALPVEAAPGDDPADVDGPEVAGAMAACRIGRVRAPIAVALPRFGAPVEAAAALDAPVVLVSP